MPRNESRADITGTFFGVILQTILQPLEGLKGLALCLLELVETSAIVTAVNRINVKVFS